MIRAGEICRKRLDCFEHGKFGSGRKSVAGLYLDRGCSGGNQRIDPWFRQGNKIILRGRSSGPNRASYSAARSENLFIG